MTARLEIPRDQIADFCRKWKIRELALFGSVLRSDFGPDSDVDVLVTFEDEVPWSLFDWIDMQDELAAMFGRRVDLVDKTAIGNPFRRRHILGSCEVFYHAA